MTTAADLPERDKVVTLNSLQYKIGRHGLVFVLIDGEWIKSTKVPSDLIPKKLKRIF